MALTEIRGRQYILLIDKDNNGTFFPVAKLLNNDFSSKMSEIDATSKEGQKMLPGDNYDQSITASCIAVDGTTTAYESYQALYGLHVAGTKFNFKFGKATPITGDVTYSGSGYVVDLNLKAEDNNIVKFDITIKPETPSMTQTVTA